MVFMSKLFDNGMYMVVENDQIDSAGIKILKGEFAGTIYMYGDVQLKEGTNHLNFKRNIVVCPEGETEETLNNDENLNNLMGDILVELIETQLKKEVTNNEQRDTKGTD
jgi:hypothetical protein|tara:strand:- start:180 stop:506 length:327 start_codon:yes stop_codon:yes gene_type:complete